MSTSDTTTEPNPSTGADAATAGPTRVRAIVQDEFGTADVLHLGEVDRPQVGKGEVLVAVRAAGLDRGTWHLVAGLPLVVRLAGFGVRRPKHRVPGSDLAGVVVEVGPDVTRFQPGDEVFGTARGSFAELAVTAEHKLARKPASLTFEQAAAVPISGGTALQAVVDIGRVESGQSVLITGASGGVGTFAVEIAKASGAEVTAVCSAPKAELVRSIGADHVLDHASDDFADGSRRYDVIIDIAGVPSLSRLRRALTPRGTAVLVGGETGGRLIGGTDRLLRAMVLSPFIGPRLRTVFGKEHHEMFERLGELADRGLLVPVIDRVYPLAEAPDALRRLDEGKVCGKVVIAI